MEKIFTLIFLICAFSLLAENSKVEQIAPDLLSEAMGGKVKTIFKEEPIKHICVFKEQSNNKNPDAYLFNTGDFGLSSNGYREDVDCYVIFSTDGTVISVIVGDNQESPKYLKKVLSSHLLQDWKGKKLNEDIPDIVSGATKTSSAINSSVNNLRAKLEEIKFFK